MHADLFELVFDARLLPGREVAEVKTNLALLFKTSPAQVEALFSGGEKIIKRQLDYPSALRYVAALKQAGALSRIRPMPVAESTSPPVTNSVAEAAVISSALSLAAVGADMLDPVEHISPPPPDVSHLSVAAVGADILEGVQKTPPPPPPDTSALSVAAVGVDLGQAPRPAAPPPPDLSYLSVAVLGADLSEHEEKLAVVVPDLSHLSLAPAPEGSNSA